MTGTWRASASNSWHFAPFRSPLLLAIRLKSLVVGHESSGHFAEQVRLGDVTSVCVAVVVPVPTQCLRQFVVGFDFECGYFVNVKRRQCDGFFH